MESSYLGGLLSRSALEERRHANANAFAGEENWWRASEEQELFLRVRGACFRTFTWDTLTLLIRGYARPTNSTGPLDLERVAEELRAQYLENGSLAVDGLEGNFTLALLDAQQRRVVLYRNLVGGGFTYYHTDAAGLLFSNNLADLVEVAGTAPQPNKAALPSFFLYRFVPGRETLFDGFYRLLPGEQVTWDEHGLERKQLHTFADLQSAPPSGDPIEALEATMAAVLRDCAAHRPQTANLLSGGIDSSYLQAVWNRVASTPDALPSSYSVSVDHPRSWIDTDYAMTAAQALGTKHTLVPAEQPYATYLLDTLSATGEPPNHVQTAYFGGLAQVMGEQRIAGGLCGEGADSLFGLGEADSLHDARWMRSWVPSRTLRRIGAVLARGLRLGWPARALRLADYLDDETHPDHPINQVAQFTDFEAVSACFGSEAVNQAAAQRRALLNQYRIPRNPLDRLHGAGFLGEAMDSASLWTTLFQRTGTDLLCPFLDSRIVSFAVSLPSRLRYRCGRPKDLLKKALARHVPAALVERKKLGFGQPIFEWLGVGGQLRPLVEQIGAYDFVDPAVLKRSLAQPNWFLYSLLCYDLWHKRFIERETRHNEPSAVGSSAVGHVSNVPEPVVVSRS